MYEPGTMFRAYESHLTGRLSDKRGTRRITGMIIAAGKFKFKFGTKGRSFNLVILADGRIFNRNVTDKSFEYWDIIVSL